MKQKIISFSAFALALIFSFAFRPAGPSAKNGPSSQTVFYTVSTACDHSKLCSNVNNNISCVTTVASYSDDKTTCDGMSAFKFRP